MTRISPIPRNFRLSYAFARVRFIPKAIHFLCHQAVPARFAAGGSGFACAEAEGGYPLRL
ncbi:hypothetical protein [Haloferula helveola]|uniref:hypothetical protein n=1 Tax=Haloferula helveola TaxID=490095 RepID=UPI0030CDE31F